MICSNCVAGHGNLSFFTALNLFTGPKIDEQKSVYLVIVVLQ